MLFRSFLETRIFNSLYLFSDVKPRNFSFAFEEDNIKIEINNYDMLNTLVAQDRIFLPLPEPDCM